MAEHAPDASGKEPRAEAKGASVIVNVIQVLRCFTLDEPLLGVTEIALRVGLHKSSVSRILATLEDQNIVERDEESRKFRLGLGLIAVAGPLLANLDVRRVAFPTLAELSETTGETAALTIWNGGEAISVEQIPSSKQVKHTSPMGSRYNTALSASVQVFLAHEPESEVRGLLESGSVILDPDTPGGIEAYLLRLAAVRDAGYAVNHGETNIEEVGLAAPVHDHRGAVIAAVMIAAPYYRVPAERLQVLGRACRQAATQIGLRLGALPR
ncbi:IclR family transcriptional regulator [Paeniglutamicibacter cryotolerans]|uniref:DNA-binding IclR family transcriptional regulator n=1 Tax=Paeniglutamicibacter cryotolerans TaxID=670079 RepID=A0A839QTY6_9MICC|nr:IclR family transcriptional regulator [Paeniglutamicibacter cryotolerans]MBB2995491.1 DNA-binding IclR family transcriptional regulator [Paeniglutamicibacter cryotolerans]